MYLWVTVEPLKPWSQSWTHQQQSPFLFHNEADTKPNPTVVACHWKECGRNISMYTRSRPTWALLLFTCLFLSENLHYFKLAVTKASLDTRLLAFLFKVSTVVPEFIVKPWSGFMPKLGPMTHSIMSQEQLTWENLPTLLLLEAAFISSHRILCTVDSKCLESHLVLVPYETSK